MPVFQLGWLLPPEAADGNFLFDRVRVRHLLRRWHEAAPSDLAEKFQEYAELGAWYFDTGPNEMRHLWAVGGQPPATVPQEVPYDPPQRVTDYPSQREATMPSDVRAPEQQQAPPQQENVSREERDAIQQENVRRGANGAQAASLGRQIDGLEAERNALDNPNGKSDQYGEFTDAYHSAMKAYNVRMDSLRSQIAALTEQRDNLRQNM